MLNTNQLSNDFKLFETVSAEWNNIDSFSKMTLQNLEKKSKGKAPPY